MGWLVDTTKLDRFLRQNRISQVELAKISGIEKSEINRLCLGHRPRPSVQPIANIYMALKQRFPNLRFEDICLRKDGQG